jgi:hypothetical protein
MVAELLRSMGWFGFATVAVVSCGMPNPLDRDRFPPRAETGYAANIDAVLSGSTGAPTDAPTIGCPEDITLLFNRPLQQGGCQGAGCHSPGNASPDLISPNPAERLRDVVSGCNGRPYIAADDSFLLDKLTASSPECGASMPFSMPEALSAEDEACILAWIDEVSAQ